MDANSAPHMNRPSRSLPSTHGLPHTLPQIVPRPEACTHCRTFYLEYHRRHPNGTRLPLDALDTLSSNSIRTSAQAYFDAARAASLRALQTSSLDQQAAETHRQRAWKDEGNAQLLNALADTMDSLKARHQQLEQQEQQNIRIRVQQSELKQQNAEVQQRNAELERQVVALKERVQNVETQRNRITERAKKKYREMQHTLDEKRTDLENMERAWVAYMTTMLGTTLIPGVHSSPVL